MNQTTTKHGLLTQDPRIHARLVYFMKTYINKKQRELSELFDMSQPSISSVLRGTRSPSLKMVNVLTDQYKLNLEWLNTGHGDPIKDAPYDPAPVNQRDLLAAYTVLSREVRFMEVQQNHLLKMTGKLQAENQAIIEMLQNLLPEHPFFKAKEEGEQAAGEQEEGGE